MIKRSAGKGLGYYGPQRRREKRLFRKASRFLLIILAAAWMLFEEWVWDNVLAVMEYTTRLKIVRSIETVLKRQHPYTLLVLFLFPFLVMLPAKIFGLYLIASGRVLRGVSLFVTAKVTITALVTRLFVISKDKLLLIPVFASFYSWFEDKRTWLYAEVRKSRAWQMARELVLRFKTAVRSTRGKIR